MPYTNLPIVAPTPGPRDFNKTYHSANGFFFRVNRFGNGQDSAAQFPAQALPWVEAALNACSYDVERLWAASPLWSSDPFNSGAPQEMQLDFYPAKRENLPDFPDDFVRIDDLGSSTFQSGTISVHIWEGLIGAQPPFGGRLFFQETVIHALGHIVGELVAVGLDLFKRKRIVTALMSDVIPRFSADVGYGYGTAWQIWDSSFDAATPWGERPTERYAEAFKDIYMLPGQKRFVNRTRTPKVDVVAVRAETHIYLPINGVDLPPHPGQFVFNGMSFMMRVQPAKSLQQGCVDRSDGGLQFVCYDPESGALNHCVPCDPDTPYDPRNPKICNQSWAAPLSTLAQMSIGVRFNLPQLKLCDPCRVWVGAPRTFDIAIPRSYECPGEEGVGAKFVEPGFGLLDNWADGANFQVSVNLGSHLIGQGILRHKGGQAWYDEGEPVILGEGTLGAHGITDFGVDFILRPTFEDYDGTVNLSNVSVSLAGMCEPFNVSPGDSFDFMADPVWLAAGYMHFPPYETYISAPSEGGATNPYSQLNLDGVDQGIYKAPTAVGAESVSPDLETREATLGVGGASLTIGGT